MIATRELQETIAPAPGTAVHVAMSSERYRATGNWSHSAIKHLPAEPELFEWKHVLKREEFVATRAMICGTAFHAWVLEGIAPTLVPADYLTKAGGMKPGGWDAIAEDFPGVPVLKRDEVTGLRYARDSCMADPEIRAYLETAGFIEHSLFAVDPETDLPTKVRLDKLCRFQDGLDCLDLKYSAGVDDRWIEKQVTGMAYYRQAGFYWEHVERAYQTPNQWTFLFVQNDPPYTARLKQLLPCDIELGARHSHVALRDLRSRLDSGNWRGLGYGVCGITNVAKWLWEKGIGDGEAPAPFAEFLEFSTDTDKE